MSLNRRFRTALITGAGSGLGAAFAERLLADGVRVWGTSRTPEKLAARVGFHPLLLELGDASSVDAAWTTADSAAGGLDLVVNNAGAAIFGPLADASTAVQEQQVDVLLRGPMRLSLLAYGAMLGRGHGTIVNVSSLAVEFPLPFVAAYNAAKSGLAAFTESLALEAVGRGVVVVDFRPGDFRTNFDYGARAPSDAVGDRVVSARVRARLEAMIATAPPPDRAARDLVRALRSGRSGTVRSGRCFQTRVAPWGNRLLPIAIMRWLRSRYFRMS